MTIAWFLTFNGPEEQRPGITNWFCENGLEALTIQPGVLSIDLFTAEKAHDPFNDDGNGPLLMVQVDFNGVDGLESLLASPAIQDSFLYHGEQLPAGCELVQGAYEVIEQAVGDNSEAQPRTAAFTYAVRYYRPAEDEKAFTDFYLSHHPQIEADFPNIRNAICYMPVTWNNPVPVPVEDIMIGNEVVFDSLADFNAAMKSDVRIRMRDDFANFPKFTGPSTHFPLSRQRVHEA
jgi:hypothetical protein